MFLKGGEKTGEPVEPSYVVFNLFSVCFIITAFEECSTSTTFQVQEGRVLQRKADPRRTGGQPGSHCWSCRKEWSSPRRPAPRHLLSSFRGFQGRSSRSSSVE